MHNRIINLTQLAILGYLRCKRSVVFAAMLLTAGCHSEGTPQRRDDLAAFLGSAEVPLLVDPSAPLAYMTPSGALTAATGFDAGARLRTQFSLRPPAVGFANGFAAALRDEPPLATMTLRIYEFPAAADLLSARGSAPVFYAHVGEWRLFYDLSLNRYRMKVWFNLQIAPATQVAAGAGGMALPGRLWTGRCTFVGPDPARTIGDWTSNNGALLRSTLEGAEAQCGRKAARLLAEFVATGKEQSVFDFGELE